MVYQYAMNTEEILTLNELGVLLKLVSIERRNRIEKYRFMKDKVHSLFAEIILRYALWVQYGIGDNCIEFRYSQYGKPYLADYPNIYFNLSHSGNWVLCGVGGVSLGIDVEFMRENDLSIADKICTGEERYFIMGQPLEKRIETFYQIWTLKESYVKNIGRGFSIPFDTFSFCKKEEDIAFYIEGKQNDRFSFYLNQLDEWHCTALCIDTHIKYMTKENIRILTLEELMEWRLKWGIKNQNSI